MSDESEMISPSLNISADAEIEAMAACFKALLPLNPHQRLNVIRAVMSLLGSHPKELPQ